MTKHKPGQRVKGHKLIRAYGGSRSEMPYYVCECGKHGKVWGLTRKDAVREHKRHKALMQLR